MPAFELPYLCDRYIYIFFSFARFFRAIATITVITDLGLIHSIEYKKYLEAQNFRQAFVPTVSNASRAQA